ncbi:MAG: hypothetical protein COT74_13280 [Bdellovibrionales bacterium CG10_big_fil_rev_8_21_14_0_10_45_34]|nr:MAG: hypothetical protein COT74_13280 [Bdellovibrionales bacterium CG10_big_fil_rev_8_21_14_0_10_45_34]
MNSANDRSNPSQQALQTALTIVGVVGACFLFYLARYVIIVSLIGVGLGVLVSPLLTKMRERFRIPRALSALLFLVVVVVSGTLVFFAVGYLVADQLEMLTSKAPEIIKNLEAKWQALYEKYPLLKEYLQDFDIAGTLKTGGQRLLKGVTSGFALISGLAFAVVIALYTSVGAKEYISSLIKAFPASKRTEAQRILICTAETLRKWFRAQMIDMVIIGSLTLLGLWAVGANYWAVFGLLTAIFGLIPYFGMLIVVTLASLVTLASDPATVPWVIGVFLVTQQIEGNLILPLVMKEHLELPEVPLLIFMLLMGTWFGLLGVFLSTPVFAVLSMLYRQLYQPIMAKR